MYLIFINFQAARVLQEQVENGNLVQQDTLSQQDKEELKVGYFSLNVLLCSILGSTWVRSTLIPKCANTKSCGKDQEKENIKLFQGRIDLFTKWFH